MESLWREQVPAIVTEEENQRELYQDKHWDVIVVGAGMARPFDCLVSAGMWEGCSGS